MNTVRLVILSYSERVKTPLRNHSVLLQFSHPQESWRKLTANHHPGCVAKDTDTMDKGSSPQHLLYWLIIITRLHSKPHYSKFLSHLNDPQPSVLASLVSLCSANNSCFQGKKKNPKTTNSRSSAFVKNKARNDTSHYLSNTFFTASSL